MSDNRRPKIHYEFDEEGNLVGKPDNTPSSNSSTSNETPIPGTYEPVVTNPHISAAPASAPTPSIPNTHEPVVINESDGEEVTAPPGDNLTPEHMNGLAELFGMLSGDFSHMAANNPSNRSVNSVSRLLSGMLSAAHPGMGNPFELNSVPYGATVEEVDDGDEVDGDDDIEDMDPQDQGQFLDEFMGPRVPFPSSRMRMMRMRMGPGGSVQMIGELPPGINIMPHPLLSGGMIPSMGLGGTNYYANANPEFKDIIADDETMKMMYNKTCRILMGHNPDFVGRFSDKILLDMFHYIKDSENLAKILSGLPDDCLDFFENIMHPIINNMYRIDREKKEEEADVFLKDYIKEAKKDDKLGDCTICLDCIVEGQKYAALPCDHTMHFDCTKKWLCESKSCPVCREKFE